MCKMDCLDSGSDSTVSIDDTRSPNMNNDLLKVETEDAFSNLLEFAANNDVEGFKICFDREASDVNEVGMWYGRKRGSNRMVLQLRTPLMVAATYGSIDVVKLIISLPEVDMNQLCGIDKSTALHCAASSGSANARDIMKLLLAAGADPNAADANGLLPFDVIVVSPKFDDMKYALQMMLTTDLLFEETRNLRVSMGTPNLNSPPFPSSPENGSPCSPSDVMPSLKSPNFNDTRMPSALGKKEYPVDPSFPDIKNSIYSTDEFRMFSFKVRPCSRAYSHDWTECPFVHPGENARRRDPRKYHYSCMPCPDFRKGACQRGDMCEYAHGVFECWLHPAHYRTRLCKDGTNCNRRVCFFAHTQDELRPLFVSTGSSFLSPRAGPSTGNPIDFTAAMSLLPCSPSNPVMSPTSFTPPMSPSANGISNTGWLPQQNVPLLHLPGSNLQSSRLRSSLNARDIPPDDLRLFPDIDVQHQHQLLKELSLLQRKILTPSNPEEYFSSENSPRFSDHALASSVFSPTRKSATLHQFQQQQQSMLSPIKTNFSPRNIDQSLMQTPFGVSSPGRVSPCPMDPMSPISARMSMIAQREKQHQQFRSLSSRDLGSNAVASFEETWSNWGSPNGAPEWAVHADELKRSSSSELPNNEDRNRNLSWVQSLVRKSSHDKNEKPAPLASCSGVTSTSSSEGANLNSQNEQTDQSVLRAWLEQLQFDQLMAL